MQKIFLAGILSLFSLLFSISDVLASNKTAEASATIKKPSLEEEMLADIPDNRVRILEHFLTMRNSPLASYAHIIIASADEYQIPWTLVTAIAGVESGFCRSIPRNSYNCWGWNNGKFYFQDYADGIVTVSQALRFKYFDRGLTTPEKISFVYAPPSKTWAGKVRRLINQIENDHSSSFLAIPLSI